MKRILGIDPGSVITGYAVIEGDGRAMRLIDSGTIRLQGDMGQRLHGIFEGVTAVVQEHTPAEMAIETVFLYKDPSAALKLGHARGAAICAGVMLDVPLYEYNTRVIKKTIVGKGNATKQQMRYMIARLMQIEERASDDETDAIGVAVCHSFSSLRSFTVAEQTR